MSRLALALLTACSYSPNSAEMAASDGAASDGPNVTDAPSDTAPVTPAWAFKRTLTINNTAIGEQTSFPLHVRLDSSRIDYAQTLADGADLRFEDAQGTPLAYEIERWNPAGSSTIWVRVPVITANAFTAITMYYGNPDAPAASNGPAVWDDDYLGVWHLVDAHDSTQTSTSVNHGGTALATGKTGPAMQFAGGVSDAHVDTGLRTFTAQWTIETWINPDTAPVIGAASSPVSGHPNYMLLYSCITSTFCQSALFNQNNGAATSFVSYAATPGVWNYVVGRYDGATIRAFVNGNQVGSNQTTATPDPATLTTKIGSRMDLEGDFDGGIDEVRISRIPRSPAYISAQFLSMADAYVAYGAQLPND